MDGDISPSEEVWKGTRLISVPIPNPIPALRLISVLVSVPISIENGDFSPMQDGLLKRRKVSSSLPSLGVREAEISATYCCMNNYPIEEVVIWVWNMSEGSRKKAVGVG